jgi:hypothetical protein
MPKKRLGAEQVVTKLRQVEVLQSQGKSISAGSGGRYLALAHRLQHGKAAFGPRIPSAGAHHHRTSTCSRRNRKHAIASHSSWCNISVRLFLCKRWAHDPRAHEKSMPVRAVTFGSACEFFICQICSQIAKLPARLSRSRKALSLRFDKR